MTGPGGASSINRRLTTAVVATTGVSLLAAALLFVAYDTWAAREALLERSTLLARVIGINSAAALAFDDRTAAEETLAGLTAAELVLAAAVFDADDRRFASYLPERSDRGFEFPTLRHGGHDWSGGKLHVFHPIELRGERLGTLYLCLGVSPLTGRVGWYALIIGVVLAGALACSSLVAARLRASISRPLGELFERSRAVAAGDLAAHAAAEPTQDEIGQLARSFDAMTGGLRNLVGQVRQSIASVSEVALVLEERASTLAVGAQRQEGAIGDVTGSIVRMGGSIREASQNVEQLAESSRETSASILQMDGAIGEIASHMDDLKRAIEIASEGSSRVSTHIAQVVSGVNALQSATESTVGSLGELSASVRDVKENAAESLALSEDSSREAADGRAAVGETIDAMGEIRSAFGEAQQRVSRLAEKSQSIGEIIEVISDVAEQTNMLSLNAAIIAAQAGEHGKAFSVVADQVNNLADRSHRSAREIAELIRAVQGDTAAVVTAVDEGSAKVKRGVERSEVAGQVLQRIMQKTRTSTDRAREIAQATLRQADDLERVDVALRAVSQIVDQIDRAAQSQHAATSEIGRAVENIRSLGAGVRESTEEQRRGSRLIADAASRVAAMATQLADAISAQSASSETIQHALDVFRGVATETTRGVEAIHGSVATLSERAKRLEDEIGRFKTR